MSLIEINSQLIPDRFISSKSKTPQFRQFESKGIIAFNMEPKAEPIGNVRESKSRKTVALLDGLVRYY